MAEFLSHHRHLRRGVFSLTLTKPRTSTVNQPGAPICPTDHTSLQDGQACTSVGTPTPIPPWLCPIPTMTLVPNNMYRRNLGVLWKEKQQSLTTFSSDFIQKKGGSPKRVPSSFEKSSLPCASEESMKCQLPCPSAFLLPPGFFPDPLCA